MADRRMLCNRLAASYNPVHYLRKPPNCQQIKLYPNYLNHLKIRNYNKDKNAVQFFKPSISYNPAPPQLPTIQMVRTHINYLKI